MPITFAPLRKYMKKNKISYYYLANQGIEAPTLQRLRKDNPISTKTLGKLCEILDCQPGQLVEYVSDKK